MKRRHVLANALWGCGVALLFVLSAGGTYLFLVIGGR
jgi:hypothetical protein